MRHHAREELRKLTAMRADVEDDAIRWHIRPQNRPHFPVMLLACGFPEMGAPRQLLT
jgi:hypothetical protein